ncbi:Ribosomal large subunit pseudouridine synthase C [Cystobacter fuscus DSM 2262]|uniref:Pseudouridine synthase n=1 Tax=Cystobacter fuscus (strain ATCC 25194 / DSM 2262 / NBRC 100088 / M29) TaxID=1242864 RepID=S9PPK7_CYSF2|nr:RluA family pseudouridine synthase [Cystobacter fuscus]EPX64981.1 Ribosomal large subunit pseudouridine synthase C [Cystobacter fuscus DSM 2262]
MIEFRIEEDSAGMRLDKFLRKKLANVPTSHLFKMIRVKKVRVNGKRAQPEQPLAAGDTISIRGTEQQLMAPAAPEERKPAPAPEVDPSELDILLEDDWLMAVNKPSGMAVHTGSGITGGTLVDYVRAYLGPKATRNDFTASPAHRLDRETSGVILVAKRRPAMVHFTDLFTNGHPRKRYLTLVKGKMPRDSGVINLPLSEHQQTAESKARRGVNMQEAVTRWKVIRQSSEAALLSCVIETGRTHQIRRHLVAIGHPVAGDKKYGDFAFNRDVRARWGLKRLFLHAEFIEFPHPAHQGKVAVEAELPPELKDVLKRAALEPS